MTTITSKTTIPAPEYHDRTISTASTDTRTLLHKTLSAATATWTLSTASIQHTYLLTILHHMKIEIRNQKTQVFIKTISYMNIYISINGQLHTNY